MTIYIPYLIDVDLQVAVTAMLPGSSSKFGKVKSLGAIVNCLGIWTSSIDNERKFFVTFVSVLIIAFTGTVIGYKILSEIIVPEEVFHFPFTAVLDSFYLFAPAQEKKYFTSSYSVITNLIVREI